MLPLMCPDESEAIKLQQAANGKLASRDVIATLL